MCVHLGETPYIFPCLAFNVFRATVPCIVLGISIVLGGNVNPVPVAPPWLAAGLLMIACSFVQRAFAEGEPAVCPPHTGPQLRHVSLSQGLSQAFLSLERFSQLYILSLL